MFGYEYHSWTSSQSLVQTPCKPPHSAKKCRLWQICQMTRWQKLKFELISIIPFHLLPIKYKSLPNLHSEGFYPTITQAFQILTLAIILNYFFSFLTILTVSIAMANSSFVGITITFTFDDGVEITTSSPRIWFFVALSLIPK